MDNFRSGKRGSNSRPIAWKAIALPTELLPLICGGNRIRTYEVIRQQIYSLSQLATLVFPLLSMREQAGFSTKPYRYMIQIQAFGARLAHLPKKQDCKTNGFFLSAKSLPIISGSSDGLLAPSGPILLTSAQFHQLHRDRIRPPESSSYGACCTTDPA